MYKAQSNQLAFDGFNESCGRQWSLDNECCVLANRIDWKMLESLYVVNFKSSKGHPVASVRQALGALVIQRRTGQSDRALIKSIAENPYYQYFIGMPSCSKRSPFTNSTLAGFHKRITVEMLQAVNDAFLKDAAPILEHGKDKRTCGAALIVTKLEQTSLASIALSVFVANLFGIPNREFLVLFLRNVPGAPCEWHFLELSEDEE